MYCFGVSTYLVEMETAVSDSNEFSQLPAPVHLWRTQSSVHVEHSVMYVTY